MQYISEHGTGVSTKPGLKVNNISVGGISTRKIKQTDDTLQDTIVGDLRLYSEAGASRV